MFSFQNGLFVCSTMAMALVLPVTVYVSARPFVEVAVIGMINDFPAGMVTLGIGSITGAAVAAMASVNRNRNNTRHINVY